MSCVFQNLAGLQNRYPNNLWQEIIGNCDIQLFLGCTDPLTAEFVSSRTGLASVAVSSQSKELGSWRISNYTPEFRETSSVGKRPVMTPDEVLRLPIDEALIIVRGKKALRVDKYDYSIHPEYRKLRSCKASAYMPEWRKLDIEQPASIPEPVPAPPKPKKPPRKKKKPAEKPPEKQAERQAEKPVEVPVEKPAKQVPKEKPKQQAAPPPPEPMQDYDLISIDKDSIMS